ncbi:alpha/beta hydrolase [Advenella mimigardefordensis]|uniref:Putative esterase n=1 Tax=Advenella mimigardefordensis (strain DSM 17166 / LMG 22922 / DPN7) TaxID=1247726 RepID=W0PFG9_ADVMD|nr:alpha/beta hydrolase [Advenella mimigardefordensis]AHG64242.1 putative esterase [Advenella mimigardefordensis DPN7]
MTNDRNQPLANPASPAKTFMLVHGAWHGAWVWHEVAQCLRNQGHIVYTPTLTGLGDRAAELSADISLETFIKDIETAILHPQSAPALVATPDADAAEALSNVILVGHSFAGLVISGVADHIADHLNRLIYLDAFVLPSGQSTFATLPEKVVNALTASAQAHRGYGIPVPDPIHLGIPADTDQYTFARGKLTPHPINTYASALSLNAPLGAGVKKIYLACTAPPYKPVAATHDWVRSQPDWIWDELSSSHSAPLLAPKMVAEKLLALTAL